MSLSSPMRSATRVAFYNAANASYRFVIAAVLLQLGVSAAWACNTPVYRYAMYNWPPAPYRVFYFHDGQPAEEDEEVNKTLDGLLDAEPAAANVLLHAIDVSQDDQLEQLPEVVREARQEHADGNKPLHVIFTPWGLKLSAGRLDPKTVQAMVDSPVRKRLSQLLAEGHTAVLLVLTGPDEEANAAAEKVAAEVAAAAASGGIPTASAFGQVPPAAELLPDPSGDPSDDDAQEEVPGAMKLAVLKLSRTDAAEQWLVRCLLSVEPDLDKYPTEPMVFAVYGRGRAMPPYVGKGITEENLTDCIVFLAGACSCMVKEQNPGMDLLVRCDWDAAAEQMAAQEEQQMVGGPFGYQEFSPGGPEDSDNEADTSLAEDTASDAPAAAEPEPESPEASAAVPAAEAPEEVVETAETAQAPDQPSSPDRPDEAPVSFAARQAWKLGIALAAAAICVLGAGLVLMRRQRPV